MMKMAGDLCSRSQTERLIWDQAQGIRRHSAQHQCHSRLGWSNSSWCSTVVQQELFITHSLFRTGTQPASKGGSYNWAWGQTTWSSIAGVGLACSNLRSSRGRLRLLTQSSRCRSKHLVQAVLLSLLAKSWRRAQVLHGTALICRVVEVAFFQICDFLWDHDRA